SVTRNGLSGRRGCRPGRGRTAPRCRCAATRSRRAGRGAAGCRWVAARGACRAIGGHLMSLAFIVLAATLAAPSDEDGFVPLFNGKDLAGWKKYDSKADLWAVEDKLIVCTGKGGGWLGTDRDYANFVLRLEYRLKPGGNSGVYIRAPEKGHISRVGMEIQILDDPWYRDEKNYKGIKPTQLTGAIYGVVPPSQDAVKPAGDWNRMEVRADGRKVVVTLNGKKIVDADLDRPLKDEAVAKEHPGLARKDGRIG